LVQVPLTALKSGPSIEIGHRLPYGPSYLGIGYCWGNSNRYRARNLVLHRKDVGQITVVALSPEMAPCLSFNKVRGDTDPAAGSAYPAFQYVAYAQLTCHSL